MKRILTAFALMLLLVSPSFAKVYDLDGLFVDHESMLSYLVETNPSLDYEIGIISIESYSGDNFFNFVKHEIAPQYFENDRIVLAICLESRDVFIETNGTAESYFRNSHTDNIRATIAPYLTNGDYASGAEIFVQYALSPPSASENFIEEKGPALLASLVISFLIAGGATYLCIYKMNTIRAHNVATIYSDQSEFNVTINREIFLYRRVTSSPKSSSSSGGGGGGGSRGGSAGKF